jgi:hypothetical protein
MCLALLEENFQWKVPVRTCCLTEMFSCTICVSLELNGDTKYVRNVKDPIIRMMFFWAILGFELRTSHLLGECSTI